MLITAVKKLDNKKYLVDIDFEHAFALYFNEIRRYEIKENDEISDNKYLEIIQEVLPKRCNNRAIYILKDSDKTEKEIRDKLKQSYYPDDIINNTIFKLREYNYLNDYRYAVNYVKYSISSKSIRRIKQELQKKGISKNDIDSIIDNKEFVDSFDKDTEDFIKEKQYKLINREFTKKHFDFELNDRKKLNNLISSLIRKGFEYDDIMYIYREKEDEYKNQLKG